MSLSTINHNDFPIRKFKQMITNRDWSLNLYNLDIEGSSPRKFGLFSNKFDFTNKNSDIDKSYPYIPKVLQKPNYNELLSYSLYSNLLIKLKNFLFYQCK